MVASCYLLPDIFRLTCKYEVDDVLQSFNRASGSVSCVIPLMMIPVSSSEDKGVQRQMICSGFPEMQATQPAA